MKRLVRLIAAACSSGAMLASFNVAAASLTDQLIEELLEKHLPHQLYQQANNPWPGGDYQMTVYKHGLPTVVSQARSIRLDLPVRVALNGKLANQLLGINMTCRAEFTTQGTVTFTPQPSSQDGTRLQATMNIPIPPANADCDNVQIPIQSSLRTLVQQYRPLWEARLADEANAWLAKPASK